VLLFFYRIIALIKFDVLFLKFLINTGPKNVEEKKNLANQM
jgi:hypothetical protein